MTTVLTLLTRDEQHAHQAVIDQWLVDNHIDTSNLAPGWISIERNDNGDDAGTGTGTDGPDQDDTDDADAGSSKNADSGKSRKGDKGDKGGKDKDADGDLFIRYHAFKRDTAGNRIPDPDGRNQSWVEERTTPLTAELPAFNDTSEATEYA